MYYLYIVRLVELTVKRYKFNRVKSLKPNPSFDTLNVVGLEYRVVKSLRAVIHPLDGWTFSLYKRVCGLKFRRVWGPGKRNLILRNILLYIYVCVHDDSHKAFRKCWIRWLNAWIYVQQLRVISKCQVYSYSVSLSLPTYFTFLDIESVNSFTN